MQPTLSRQLASVVHHHHITSLSSASENNELKGLSSGITVRYWKDTVYVALRDVYISIFSNLIFRRINSPAQEPLSGYSQRQDSNRETWSMVNGNCKIPRCRSKNGRLLCKRLLTEIKQLLHIKYFTTKAESKPELFPVLAYCILV